MVDLIQSIQEIGFREETIEGTSVITNTVKPIHFGVYETTWGKMPSYIQDVQSYYRGNLYDPYRNTVSKTSIAGQVSFVPTDGLFWKFGMGNGVSGGTNIHSIVPINSGDLPSFSLRYETSNGTDFHRKDAVGCKVKRLSTSINFLQPDNFMVNNLTYIGMDLISESSLTDNQNIEPIYADGNTIDEQTPYRVDSQFEWKWDSDGDNVELKTVGLDFIYVLDTMNRLRHYDGQKSAMRATTGNRQHAVAFRILRKGITDVFDDYVAQPPLDTFKNMTFKIYSSAVKYIKFTFTNITMSKCEINKAMLESGEEPYYEIEAIPTAVVVEIYDGVSTTLYGY